MDNPTLIKKKKSEKNIQVWVLTAFIGGLFALLTLTPSWITFSGKKVDTQTITGFGISKQLPGLSKVAPYLILFFALITICLVVYTWKQKKVSYRVTFSLIAAGTLGLAVSLWQISAIRKQFLDGDYSNTQYHFGMWGNILGFFMVVLCGIMVLRETSTTFHSKSGRILLYAILIFGAIVAIYPFFWMISTSLMTLGETILKKPLPSEPQWENYKEAWTEAKFANYFINSIIITLTTMIGLLVTSILAAYAFAKIKFFGKNVVFTLLLATMMIPESVTIIPNFLMIRGDIIKMPGIPNTWFETLYNNTMESYANQVKDALNEPIITKEKDPTRVVKRAEIWVRNTEKTLSDENDQAVADEQAAKLKSVKPILRKYNLFTKIYERLTTIIPYGSWLNSLAALSVPFMANAFSIFMLRQFFSKIPDEYWDAARIDGAGHLRFLVKIVLPMSRASIMTVIVFSFIGSWNAFLWPLLATTKATWRPLMVGLWTFVSEAGPETQLLMAGAVITILPILLLYFLTQKQFTEGIATTGLKG